MSISAAEASRLTGKSKQAIINAIKLGKISAQKNVDGAWQLEPVELFRHYQPVSSFTNGNGNGHHTLDTLLDPQLDDTRHPLDTACQVENEQLRARLADAHDQIGDLRRRLDESSAQVTQLSAIIAELAPPQPRRGWWQRLLGG